MSIYVSKALISYFCLHDASSKRPICGCHAMNRNMSFCKADDVGIMYGYFG